MSTSTKNRAPKTAGGDRVLIQDSEVGRLLAELEKGKFLPKVEEKLREVALASEEHGGKGELTISLKFSTQTGRSASTTILACVKSKVPESGQKPMVRFLHQGGFIKEEPDQMQMDLDDEEEGNGADGTDRTNEGKGAVVAFEEGKRRRA